jgi:hypothetical protein
MEKRQARSFNFLVPVVGLEEFSTPDKHNKDERLILITFLSHVHTDSPSATSELRYFSQQDSKI